MVAVAVVVVMVFSVKVRTLVLVVVASSTTALVMVLVIVAPSRTPELTVCAGEARQWTNQRQRHRVWQRRQWRQGSLH